MKKLIAIALVCFLAVGCAETTTKEEKTTTETNGASDNNKVDEREKEIRDSTKMLDAQLSDTSSN